MKRKIYKLLLNAKHGLFALALTVFSGTAYSQTTYTFNYTGSTQTLAVAPGSYEIECWGADGGWGGTASALTGTGGIGGYSKGIYTVASPTILYIYVGGVGQSTTTAGASMITAAGGWNGGGGGRSGSSNSYYRGGGGGGTDVRTTQNTVYSDRIIVAGGGGGSGGSSGTPLTYVGSGGNGGGTSGQDGVLGGSQTNHNGKGGTQSAGGAGGVYSTNLGIAGSFGLGGDGGGTGNAFPAGGGGGGWYGGGGGATQGGGGGGGSAYIGGVTSGTTIMFGQTGFVSNPDITGNGMMLIKELCSISLSVTGATNGSVCAGNSVTLTTNAVSNYSWTNGSTASFLVVAPGTNTVYGLTATSPSNCTSSAQVSITLNPLPTLNLSTSNPLVCLGNPAVISASGAHSYLWSTNSTANNVTVVPVQNTTYSVTGTNTITNCSSTETVVVDVFTSSVTIIGNTVICKGNTATLTAGSVGAISYSWSTGLPIQSILVSPPSHAIYVVTAVISTLNINCTSINSVQVTVNDVPNILPVPNRRTACVDETVLFSATGGTAYAWSWGSQTSNTANFTVTPTTMTTMIASVTGTANNGCTNTGTVSVQIMSCTGINEGNISDNLIQVYPNPSQGEINVTFHSPIELLLINGTGQLIRKLSLNDENGYKASITELSTGIYFVTGQSGTSGINKKIVVTR